VSILTSSSAGLLSSRPHSLNLAFPGRYQPLSSLLCMHVKMKRILQKQFLVLPMAWSFFSFRRFCSSRFRDDHLVGPLSLFFSSRSFLCHLVYSFTSLRGPPCAVHRRPFSRQELSLSVARGPVIRRLPPLMGCSDSRSRRLWSLPIRSFGTALFSRLLWPLQNTL